MVTAQEIVVSLQSDGTQEVASDVNDIEQEFEETSASVGESADELEGFSSEFGGAMSAIVAGLAVAAGGLLSQVPVVGGLMESLFSIVEAVAFQMDQVLRPILQPVADQFYEWSSAIFEADGALGDIIGVVGTIIATVALVAGIVWGAIQAFGALVAVKGALVAAGGALIGALKTIVLAIAGAISWPVLLGAALIALAFIFRDEIANAIDVAIGWISSFIGAIGKAAGNVWDALGNIGSGFFEWAENLISSAFSWGIDLIDQFTSGITEAAEDIGGKIADFFDFGDISSDLSSSVSMDAGEFEMEGMEDFESDFQSDITLPSKTGDGENGGGMSMGEFRDMYSNFEGGSTSLDGRRLDESTGRYGKDRNTRRSGF